MISRSNEVHENRDQFEISAWENEGGAPGRDNMDHHYGRRIEIDRTWTVYHVFTGVPADAGGRAMIGLSRADAADRLQSLNLSNAARRKERRRLNPPGLEMLEIERISSWR